MGNQGTKNWKLSAFFVISLMLIAGLFSGNALAASGDGMVTYALQNITDTPHTFVPVGYKGFNLTFTYTLPIAVADKNSLAKGEVKIQIPAGWTVTDQSLSPEPIATTMMA